MLNTRDSRAKSWGTRAEWKLAEAEAELATATRSERELITTWVGSRYILVEVSELTS